MGVDAHSASNEWLRRCSNVDVLKTVQGAPESNPPPRKFYRPISGIVKDFFTKLTAFTCEDSVHISCKFCYNNYNNKMWFNRYNSLNFRIHVSSEREHASWITGWTVQVKLDLEIFRSIWPLTLKVQRENTPYSSSELNESDIVNRQTGGEKLKICT